MQGTVVMLMALSGLGCHHKACDTVYAPSASSCYSACYSSGGFGGCYSSGCYGGDIVGSCYSSGYDFTSSSCYSSSCYSSSCFSSSCYSSCYSSSCYSSCYSGKHKGGCGIGRLFSGLFHGHKWHNYQGYNAYASDDYVASAPFYSSGYSELPVFGANVPVYSSGQTYGSGQIIGSPVVDTPSTSTVTPEPPAAPKADTPKVEDAVPTPPVPAAVPPPAKPKV